MSTQYCGIDLHARKSRIAVLTNGNRYVVDETVDNDYPRIASLLRPYRRRLKVAVESTINWYWLVDELQDDGFEVVLVDSANCSAISDAKIKTDKRDARKLAKLLKADVLPTGYIYPKETRPVRDALRRRCQLVTQRATEYSSLQRLMLKYNHHGFTRNSIKRFTEDMIPRYFTNPFLKADCHLILQRIQLLDAQIECLETGIMHEATKTPDYSLLQTIPGFGVILALLVKYEVGDINRFPDARHFSSYARVFPGVAASSTKTKRGRKSKQGNPYLKWAFSQAACQAVYHYPRVRAYFNRKAKKKPRIVAYATIAHKLALAAYQVLKTSTPYNEELLFQ